MTSRERVRATIAHKEPDRTPIDLGSTPSSGIAGIAYNRLAKHLGLPDSRTRIYDVVQELAQPEPEVLDWAGVDVLDVGQTYNVDDSDWYPVEIAPGVEAFYPAWFHPESDERGGLSAHHNGEVIARKPGGANFFDQTVFPYLDGYPDDYTGLRQEMDRVLWSALVHSPWDHAGEPDFWEGLRQRATQLRDSTDKALMIVFGGNLFEWGTFLRRIDNFLMDVYAEPDEVRRLVDHLLEIHLENLGKVCDAVGDVVDLIRFGDDLGMDSGPFMSPDHYRRLFMPAHKEMLSFVTSHSSMTPFLHSCGSIYQLVPSLIEAGFQVLNPVQTNCLNMEPARLKSEFGSEVTFWGGGADPREILNRGTPEEVAADVTRRLEVFAPGGGYVFNTVHNILPDVPPENIVAMYEAVHDFNR